MELWTAFLLGFLGSFHCVGMCGPIAMSIPRTSSNTRVLISHALLYNGGRVLTYTMLGLIFGLIGRQISLIGYQSLLSILLGSAVVLSVLFPAIAKRVHALRFYEVYLNAINRRFKTMLETETRFSLIGLGLLNGMLPCAFVYTGLAAAVLTHSVSHSAGYMAFFGLGTVPAMLFMYLAPTMFSLEARTKIRKAIPVMATVFGVVLIIRGVALSELTAYPGLASGIDAFCIFPGTEMNAR
ncbi:MAG: sulfite exporter TauE/SafE family protein [Bacteroidota bacterium]